MSYEMLVGLEVKDDELYSQYREKMTPILKEFFGGFKYDFKIQETLKSEVDTPINRVFTIYFKDKKNMDEFFSDSRYLKVKEEFFEGSVSNTTIISEYVTQ